MRILVLCSMDIRKKGAGKTHLMEVCENLKNLGNEVLLIAPGYSPLSKIEAEFPIHYIKLGKKSYFTYIIYHLKLQMQLHRVLRNFRPDVIYSRGILNGFLLHKKFKHSSPFVIEKNSILPDEFKMRGFNKIFVKIMEVLERLNAKDCDGIVAVTESVKEELIKRYGINYKKIIVVPNGANHKLFVPMSKEKVRKELNLDKDSFIVGFVGSFAPWQSLDLLVEAANIIKKRMASEKIKYLLVGDGETKKEILALIKKYDLGTDFILAGRVDYRKIPEYINASDLVITLKAKALGVKLFSPLKFFEYAFCGIPIIFSNNIIGNRLDEFKNMIGYEIENNDPKTIASAIINAYNDIEILKRNISSIRNALVQHYSWLNSAKEVEKFLYSIKKKGLTINESN